MSKLLNQNVVSLYSHRSRVHDRLSGTKGNFKETLKRIKNLIKSRQRESIIINIPVIASDCLKNSNYFRLNGILKLIKNLGIKKAQFALVNPPVNNPIVSLDKVAFYISKARYVFLFDLLIKVGGVPYCLIPEPEGMINKSDQPQNFLKLKKCQPCRYFNQCDGILENYFKSLDKSKIKPETLPKEVMIEVEPRCNFRCQFCFNRLSFAKSGHKGDGLGTSYVKKIIDNIKKAGVPVVRFTGGEPMLRSDIFELAKYAKSKKLQVRLNTNGSLIRNYKMARKMAKHLDYVLFSVHTYDPKKDEKITGVKNSFEKKMRAISWFKKAGVKVVRVTTIATMDNIRNLDKFYKLFKKLKIDKWAVNRIIPTSNKEKIWGKKEVPLLVRKLVKIRKDIVKHNLPLKVHIVNAIPLCSYDPVKVNAVCAGGHSVDGHERYAIDPRGFAKPIYYIEKNIGDPLNIKACWNHPFMKALRNYKLLPKECKQCPLLEKCKGGNRFCAFAASGSYSAPDPLMDFSKIKDYIW